MVVDNWLKQQNYFYKLKLFWKASGKLLYASYSPESNADGKKNLKK